MVRDSVGSLLGYGTVNCAGLVRVLLMVLWFVCFGDFVLLVLRGWVGVSRNL